MEMAWRCLQEGMWQLHRNWPPFEVPKVAPPHAALHGSFQGSFFSKQFGQTLGKSKKKLTDISFT